MQRVKDRRSGISLGAVVIALVAAGLVAGCTSSDSAPSTGAALPGAVYGSQIPLYPSATLEGAMGGTGYARLGGPAMSESLSWFFVVADPPEKVLAFYEVKLPGATRDVTDGDNPTLTIVPAGAEAGEYLRVTVRPGKLQITEVVKAGKRKDD
jgi:hypothetical protein